MLREKDRINIRNIENQSLRLGKIADIRVGIATCKDSVYFIDGSTLQGNRYFKTYQGKVFPIEKEVTLPIAKISRFRNLEELKTNTARIIFPYRRSNGKASIIPEKEFRSLYPLCYNYFLAAKAELATRDKGMTKYPEWYAYARTQGLNFYGTKLLTPTFSAMPRFMLENNKEALFCNGYAVYLTDGERKISSPGQNGKLSLNLLGKILNSRIMDYYVKLTSVSIEGGFPCYQKNFIELFGIPEFTPEEYVFLENEGDKQKIDAFLTKKYNLSFS